MDVADTRTRVESDPESSGISSNGDKAGRSEPLASKENCRSSSSSTQDESPTRSIPSLAGTKSGDTSSSRSVNSTETCSIGEHHYQQQQPPPTLWETADDLSTIRLHHSKRLFKSHSFPRPSKGLNFDFFVPPISHHHALLRKQKKKSKRERKTAVGAVGGMVAGCLALGPAGVVLGAAVGGYVTRQIAKKAEKRSQRKKEQESVRNYATSKSLQWELNDDAVMLT